MSDYLKDNHSFSNGLNNGQVLRKKSRISKRYGLRKSTRRKEKNLRINGRFTMLKSITDLRIKKTKETKIL